MRTRKDKVCICCPMCGKFHGKSAQSEIEFTCIKCGAKFVAIVENGRVATFVSQRSIDYNKAVSNA